MIKPVTGAPEMNSGMVHDARCACWRRFHGLREIRAARHWVEVMPLLEWVENQVAADGVWAMGFVTYEAAPAMDPALAVRPSGSLPLAWFGIYESAEPVALAALAPDEIKPALAWEPGASLPAYREAIRKIKNYIQAGETYQVNYTLRLRAGFPQRPWPFFRQMLAAQEARYGAYIETRDWAIASASPELFFEGDGGRLVSRPMKGTRPRGLCFEDDEAQAGQLRSSAKERAENVMIVDMVRNDLGRVARPGSVRVGSLFEVERYRTLWQMTSQVECQTDHGLPEIFRALFPAASITGAPKPRTMRIISELEMDPRGVYTGAIGFVAPGGRAQFAVAIRTLHLDKTCHRAEYGVGGGIVWDSTAEAEYEECRIKAGVLAAPVPEFRLLETMLWTPEAGFSLLDEHLIRLQKSARYFDFRFHREHIETGLREAARPLPSRPHKFRLLVARDGTPGIEIHPVEPWAQPVRLGLARQPVQTANVFLYHKTTHREVYEQARRDHPEAGDVLLWNERGEITESCLANVLVKIGGEWFTPPLACGLLPGTFRAQLLAQGAVREKVIKTGELSHCAQILLVNSVRGKYEAFLPR